MKNKKLNFKIDKRILIYILALILGLIVGFIPYILSGIKMFVPISPFVFLMLAVLLYPAIVENKETKKINKEVKNYLKFYDMLFDYSSLTSSFKTGFELTLNNLDISSLKEKLNDYCEGESKGVLPLSLCNNRHEIYLIDRLSKLIKADEYSKDEYYDALNEYKQYKLSVIKKQNIINYYLPFIAVIVTYLISLVFAIVTNE